MLYNFGINCCSKIMTPRLESESTHLLKGNKNIPLTFPLLSPICEQDSIVIVDSLRNILETSCRPGFKRMYLSHSQMPK